MKHFLANKKKAFALLLLTLTGSSIFAQGSAGIDQATSELTTYIDPIGSFILVIGAIVGLVGGVRVYMKWNSGDSDVNKSVMSWFGSCIFLVLVGSVIRAFFGV